jgi:Ca-activated chloride channel family protein
MQDIHTEMLIGGTAVGSGLATAVTRLKDSKAKSKVVILLTDGVSNSGSIAPLKAAQIAQTFGIRVYTIGVGTRGTAKVPVMTHFGQELVEQEVEIDEATMTEIADITGGKYFRATDNASLAAIYDEIDQMEKTILEVREYTKRTEEYLPFAIAAMLLLLAELLLKNTILRTLP